MREKTPITRIGLGCYRHVRNLGLKRILGRFAFGLLATLAISGLGHAMAHPTDDEHEEALVLIWQMSEGSAASTSIPTGFEDTVGYDPVVRADLVTDPHGGCSTPAGIGPGFFDTACRTHDLGYDVLRFAENRGNRLGAWARAEIDLLFYRDLLESCGAVTCQVTATVYYTAVTANSIRQGYKAPTDEPTMPWVMIWLTVVGLAVVPPARNDTSSRDVVSRLRAGWRKANKGMRRRALPA